jgi:hypothetical protein
LPLATSPTTDRPGAQRLVRARVAWCDRLADELWVMGVALVLPAEKVTA